MKLLAKLLSFVLAGALFIVTASCTYDLLTQILPAKYWYLPVCGIGSFDIGVIAWLLTLLHGTENSEQRSIAWIMFVVDFAGVATTTLSDVFFTDQAKGLVAALPPEWTRWVVVALVAIIVLNVMGWMAMHIADPKYITKTTGHRATPIPASGRVRVVEGRATQRPAVRVAAKPRRALPPPKQAAPATMAVEEPLEESAAEDESEEFEDGDEQLEDDSEYTDTEQLDDSAEEVTAPSLPLLDRVAGAWDALTAPNATGPTRLPRKR